MLQIPTYGIFEGISSLGELAAMPQWTAERPLRLVTGYTYVRVSSPPVRCSLIALDHCSFPPFMTCLPAVQLGKKFLAENGLKHVQLSTADGALEAAPAV